MNKTNKKPHVMLFFSYGMSLQAWAESGLIGRELLIYLKMVRQGYNVTLMTYGDETDYAYSDQLKGICIIPVFSIIKKSKNRWINLFKSFFLPFHKMFKNQFAKADIYKTNQMAGSWVPIIAGILYHKPVVVRCGYEMLRNLLRDEKNPAIWAMKAIFGYALEFIAYTSADKIVISNQSDKKFVEHLFPVKKGKFRLIRNFIDTDHFCPDKSNPIGKNTKNALYIGRIKKLKNIENLIYACNSSGCALNLVGKGENEHYFMDIAKNSHGDIHFNGRVDNSNLPEIIRKSDIFILPSFYEGNPKALLEAMACGRVVLGTDVPGIRELIIDGETGFLCNTDAISIAKAINTIFDMPCEKLNIIASNARRFVMKECAIEHVFNYEMNLYKELLP